MRDVVNSVYNSSTLPTKSKVVRMNSGGGTVRAGYKSYRDFLESYGDKNCKDDQESVSSTDSGISSSCKLSESKSNNTSTSSLNSDINGSSSKVLQKTESNITSRTGSFRNYMEGYSNKKFSSVKPNIAPKQNTVKSEIIIQVNDPLEKSKNEPEKIYVTTIGGDVHEDGEDKTDAATNVLSRPSFGNYKQIKMALSQCFEPQHELNIKLTNATTPSLSHEEISTIAPPPPPPPLEPKFNYSATNGSIPPPPPPPLLDLNTTTKKWETVKVENNQPNINPPSQQEKLPENHTAAANLAKILTQHLLPRRKELDRLEQNGANSETIQSGPKCKEIDQESDIKNSKCKTYVLIAPKIPSQQPPKLPTSPPPPIPKQQPYLESKVYVPSSPVFTKQIKNADNSAPPRVPVFSPTMSKRFPNVDTSLPKPPPAFLRQPQKVTAELQKTSPPELPKTAPPKVLNGRDSPNSSGNVEYNTTTVVPITDTTAKVSKTDPNVRKLVYNTYRGLLGAYNNRANDMIATLPRNMVKEDKGVSKQLESIALQGGFEKLNGRTNPNVEQE